MVLDEQAWAARRLRPVRELAAAYDRLLANSRFTQHWIERRWGLPSEVIYPPVELDDLETGERRPYILSIGRFFAGGHNKKHLPMIAAFRALCDAGLDDWEYHLAGGCDLAMPEHRAYLEQVRAAAAGYPIHLHVNASSAELRKLTATAQIFWHATGLEEDEERTPERLEHFGITTVEAMAAGCVPVVIARGGQVEIVEHGVSGLLWQTLPELQAHTRALIENPLLRARLSAGAQQRSRSFGLDRFRRDVLALLEHLGR
jgi:glycosyltransferase involved in cell wall biosynthesis